MNDQCCLLHQWQVSPSQQQLIGAAKSVKLPNPINSTGAPQPTGERGAISSTPSTPRRSTRTTKGVPPVHYTPSKK